MTDERRLRTRIWESGSTTGLFWVHREVQAPGGGVIKSRVVTWGTQAMPARAGIARELASVGVAMLGGRPDQIARVTGGRFELLRYGLSRAATRVPIAL